MRDFRLLSVVSLIFALSHHSKAETSLPDWRDWRCSDSVPGFDFDIERASGIWYEAARLPASDIPACVQVIAPPAIQNDRYTLQVNYMNNIGKEWVPTNETVDFPWDDNTKKGFFTLVYGTKPVTMRVEFKIVAIDYRGVALVCGYSPLVPAYSMLKVMTRSSTQDPELMALIQKFADRYGIGSQLTWVYHSERCNGALKVGPGVMLWLLLFYGVRKLTEVV